MVPTANLWRARPAVLSLATIAAACGIIIIYGMYSRQVPASIPKRSNAVHRPRRDRHMPTFDWSPASPDAPLGTIVIRRSDFAYVIDLAVGPFPDIDDLQFFFPLAPHDIRTELVDLALDLVLSSCFHATSQSDSWTSLHQLGLGDVVVAMASREVVQIRRHSGGIRSILHLDGTADEQVQRAVTRFVDSEAWLGNFDASAEDEGAEPAETEENDMLDTAGTEPSPGLRGLLYYIAEEDAKHKAYEHRGIHCEECGELPIRGVRWHCLNCPDFDLCASCEPHTAHPKTHVFAKIKIPLPILSQPTKEYRLWYPGDPRKIHPPLDAVHKKRLCREHGFDEPRVDALYDQFTCLANVPWQADACDIKAAIDKRAFNKALSCEKWSNVATANALYDRMFAFYDTDGNGLIGFEEFLSGFAYLRGRTRFGSLQRAIQGYDLDDDGLVDRADFMRLLRAKFIVQQQLVRDSIEGQEIELTQDALETLRSSQPISSVFAQEDIPPGESRPRRGKGSDEFGDMQPLPGTKTILDDDDAWPSTRLRVDRRSMLAHERLQENFSRFDDLLAGSTIDSSQREGREQADSSSPICVAGDFDEDSLSELDLSSLNGTGDGLVEPHIQDILWQATENGLKSLLDGFFLVKEQEDQEAINTRDERARWYKDIQLLMEKEQEMTVAKDDPDRVTAENPKGSHHPARPLTLIEDVTQPFTGGMVPTDWESLERHEQVITDTSLEQLLSATGYSLRDDEAETNNDAVSVEEPLENPAGRIASPQVQEPVQHYAIRPLRTASFSSTSDAPGSRDPTLPQNMPNGHVNSCNVSASERENEYPRSMSTIEMSPQRPMSRQRLQYLRRMHEVDQLLQDRGGPGRLANYEIEAIALSKGGELQALVQSWLEWASF